ncbi:transposase [Iamia sp.]|uniref:transposase n=1 Tax=Iamia sp. TaxID=2722710 RepID=UPI0039C8A485
MASLPQRGRRPRSPGAQLPTQGDEPQRRRRAAHVHFPHVHRVAALLKRWLLGTHQGSVEAHHLDQYLDEFVFRFNRRSSRNRGLVFWRLVCDLVDPGVTATTRATIATRKSAVATSDAQLADAIEAWKKEHKRQVQAASRRRAKDKPPAAEPHDG